MKQLIFCFLLCLALLNPLRAEAKEIFASPEIRVELKCFSLAEKTLLVFWLDMRAGWHAYANSEKKSGKPTVLSFQAEDKKNGEPDIEVFYPAGRELADVYNPKVKIAGYEGRTPIFARIGNAVSGQVLYGRLDMLLCSTQSCLPLRASLKIELPELKFLPPVSGESELYELWQKSLPEAGSGIKIKEPSAGALRYPAAERGSPGSGYAVNATSWPAELKFTPRFLLHGVEVADMGKALLLGILAGLLLNAMPCVLPVLTLKVSVLLAASSSADKIEQKKLLQKQSLFFALGMISFFVFLAVLAGASGYIWGQSFQNPVIVHGLAVLVCLLGVSMFGVYTLPVIDLKADGGSSSTQAYLTGLFTTLLATPCSGPLLGGVLGWSFTQPGPARAVIFTAVGLGMAAPHLILATRPGLARFLPRPGPWMAVVEKTSGFFLLGLGLYLISILPSDMRFSVLSGILLMAFAAWIWGTFGGIYAPNLTRKLIVGGLVALMAVPAAVFPYCQDSPGAHWENFDPESFRQSLGRENMLLDFTADWCPNCKFLESSALSDSNVAVWKEKFNLRLIRVDLTRHNQAGQNLLKALGSSSIPLAAVFPAGKKAMSPVVLRDIFNTGQMEEGLSTAINLKN